MSSASAYLARRRVRRLALGVAAVALLVVLAGCTNAPALQPGGIQPAATATGATGPAVATPAAGATRTPRPSPIPAANVRIDINGRDTHLSITPRKVAEVLVTDAPIDVVVHYPGSLNGRETSVNLVQPYSVRWPYELSLAEDPNTVAFKLVGTDPGFFTVQVTAEGYAPVLFSIHVAALPTPGPGTPQEVTPLPGTPPAATPAAGTSQPANLATAEVGTSVPSLGPIVSTALPGTGSSGSETPTAAPAPAGGTRTVTLADAGSTLTLRPGERFVLALGEVYDWQVTVADPAIVSRVVNITPIRGSQGVYEAHKSGQTTVTAEGEPACRKVQPPCMMPSRLFDVQVVVQ